MGPRWKTLSFVPFLTFSCLLAQCGCSAMKVKLGMRVDLAQTPAASIEASLPKGPGIAPGLKSPLVVQVTQPDGKVLLTEGQGGGKVQWKDLQVTASVVNVNQKGIVSLAKDPRVSDNKVGHVTVTVPSHPGLRADLDIPFRYDIAYTSDFSGKPGMGGTSGLDGTDGTSGMSGSMDPNNPSPGGDGTNGSNGSDGHDGDSGGNAPPVDVRMTLQPGSDPLLQVSVSAAGRRKLYLIDPRGGSLMVKADGGPGGSGGRGGRGGRGGSGGIGTPNGRDGSSGMDGRSGFDGQPGRGGSITVTYDPAAKPFLNIIHLSSRNGPPSVFREAAVAALW